MPFRLWFYLAKVGGFILFATIAATFFSPADSPLGQLRSIALWIFIPLCLVGASTGVLLALGKLRMRCPFCGKSGPVGGNKQDGMWMECETCGLVHSGGPLGLKIIREEIAEDEEST